VCWERRSVPRTLGTFGQKRGQGMRATVSPQPRLCSDPERRRTSMVSLHRVHQCTPPSSADSPYFMPYFGTPVFYPFEKSFWQSRPRLRRCSPIPNPTHLQLPYTTCLRSCQARVWTRLERMEPRLRLAYMLRRRIGKQLRHKPRAVLVSDPGLRTAST